MRNDDTAVSDAELMRRIAGGDAQAFRTLSLSHVDRLLALAVRLLGDRAEAEDVVQDCFLRVWRDAGKWKADAAVATWLHRIAYNLCIDRLRRRRDTAPIEDVDPPSQDRSADRGIQDRDVATRVDAALANLPDRQREALILVHFQELSGRDAAGIMDITVEALESLLAHGRRALKTALIGEKEDLIGVEP